MYKILVMLITFGLLSSSANAASKKPQRPVEASSPAPTSRSSIEIGYYPGSSTKDELFYWSQKYIPLARHLSSKSGSAITLVPEPNVQVLKNLIKGQRYRWMYINADLAVLAQEIAYTPVAKQSVDSEAVLVVRQDSPLNKYSDLSGKRLGLVKTTTIGTFARYKLTETKTNAEIVDVPQGQDYILQLLDLGRIDAAAVRKDFALDLNRRYPKRFRIADSAGEAPGFVLLAHMSVSNDEVERVRSGFLSLHSEDPTAQKIMSMQGETATQGPYFVEWNRDFLKNTRKAVAAVEPDYGRFVFDPVNGEYTEAYKIFTSESLEAKKN